MLMGIFSNMGTFLRKPVSCFHRYSTSGRMYFLQQSGDTLATSVFLSIISWYFLQSRESVLAAIVLVRVLEVRTVHDKAVVG